MFIAKAPVLLRYLYPSCIWKIPNENNTVFLTFDDGPTDKITERVLSILKEESIKATFFCVGKQIEKNPLLFQKILDEGHAIGNHSHDHVNGWKTNKKEYLSNIQKCQELINSQLFRPPYGKIKPSQLKVLNKKYKIIMWDVAGGDFLPNISPENIIKNVVNNTESGSIIVLHDNNKFGEKMLTTLPEIIKKLKEKEFLFSPITNAHVPF